MRLSVNLLLGGVVMSCDINRELGSGFKMEVEEKGKPKWRFAGNTFVKMFESVLVHTMGTNSNMSLCIKWFRITHVSMRLYHCKTYGGSTVGTDEIMVHKTALD